MVTDQKIQSEILAYFLTITLVFTLAARYGRQVMAWVLMKLYDFFIMNNQMRS